MKVHLIKDKTIDNYILSNARAGTSLNYWREKIKKADWNIPEDMNSTFNSVDFLCRGSKRVVFNIGSNNYRMICKYAFSKKRVHLFIYWLGTYAEYDKLCAAQQQYDIVLF